MKIAACLGALTAPLLFAMSAHPQQSPGSVSTNSAGSALVCANPIGKPAIPGKRFVHCLDGTVVDTTTGLMWELKDTACAQGDLHCVQNTYTWSSSGNARDGTLFTVFLAGLNTDDVTHVSLTPVPYSENPTPTCFANHCDWRIPNIGELQTIRDIDLATAPGCAVGLKGGAPGGQPCIDQAAFDAPGFSTETNFYFSSTNDSAFGNDLYVWGVYFENGFIGQGSKTYPRSARAVRGGG